MSLGCTVQKYLASTGDKTSALVDGSSRSPWFVWATSTILNVVDGTRYVSVL
jgi:hypothetical protein